MSRVVRPVFLCFFVSLLTFAAEPPHRVPSRFDTQLHLFAAREASYPQVPSPDPEIPSADHGKKSVGLAAIYSLVLPGAGELYAGGFGSGKYFMIAEGALWLTYAALDIYGSSLQDDARAFAVARAGVNTEGKSDQYFIDIGNFIDIAEYNEKQLRDREADKLYDPLAGFAWRWEADDLRAQYRAQRIDAENMFNNRKFVIAAVIINHVASAINAARSAVSYNKSLDQGGGMGFGASVLGGLSHPHGILLTVTRSF